MTLVRRATATRFSAVACSEQMTGARGVRVRLEAHHDIRKAEKPSRSLRDDVNQAIEGRAEARATGARFERKNGIRPWHSSPD